METFLILPGSSSASFPAQKSPTILQAYYFLILTNSTIYGNYVRRWPDHKICVLHKSFTFRSFAWYKICNIFSMNMDTSTASLDTLSVDFNRIKSRNVLQKISSLVSSKKQDVLNMVHASEDYFSTLHSPEDLVAIYDQAEIEPLEFYRNFMFANRPLLIRHHENKFSYDSQSTSFGKTSKTLYHLKPLLANKWRRRIDSTINEEETRWSWQVDHEYMIQHYGDDLVPIKSISETEQEQIIKEEHICLKQWIRNGLINNPTFYLKDWHFILDHPDQHLYDVPRYFHYDWLSPFFLHYKCPSDDFRFIYWGGTQSVTPFHVDVLNSFSWSTNVCGEKKWILQAPQAVVDSFTDPSARAMLLNLVFFQQQDETIFIPSGWRHKVINLKETLSVNQNWINGANIKMVSQCVFEEHDSMVEQLCKYGIADSVDWSHLCTLVRACCKLSVEDLVLLSTHELLCIFESIDTASNLRDAVILLAFLKNTFDVLQSCHQKFPASTREDNKTYSFLSEFLDYFNELLI